MKRWAFILILSVLFSLWLPAMATMETQGTGVVSAQTEDLDDTGLTDEQWVDEVPSEEDVDPEDGTEELDPTPDAPDDADTGDYDPDQTEPSPELPEPDSDQPDEGAENHGPIQDENSAETEPASDAEAEPEGDVLEDPEGEDTSSDRIIQPEEGFDYTAFDFYAKAKELTAAYPELLKLDVLGYSADGRPVFVLVMAEGIRTRSYEEIYIQRSQLFLEGGTHSRETINSYLLMRTIEDYCMDAANNAHIPGIDVASILKKGTFHFLILTNPDGYDAVKHGVNAIRNTTLRQKLINLLAGRSVSLLKAGIEGVDRNRNFTDEYYNVSTRRWINQFYTKNVDSPQEPSLENYPGPYPASQLETQMVQNYMQRYPFRAFLSYHSMGRVIYYVKEYMPTSFNENVLRPFAVMAAGVTGYRIIDYISTTSAGGYLTHFAVNITQKPTLTVETTPERTFPTLYRYYEEEYERVKLLPYRSMEYVIQKGYFPYRVYVGGKFFQDYQSETYAMGVAQKLMGTVVASSGVPVYEHILVFTDGKKIPFSAASGAPFITNGRTMLPVRRVAETLGADVTWNQSLYQAEIYWDDQRIEIPINKDYIVVNGKTIMMDTVNMMHFNRTYVPLRFVFQSMGYRVSWYLEAGQHLINIDTPQS
jgi:g-D-glutamyl-meso-diaminopimelate peptidase